MAAQGVLYFPDANSRQTYFTMHNLHAAHELSRGAGVKVGILDHGFGVERWPGLYAGGETFQAEAYRESFRRGRSHGYGLALVLREVAPEAEIYALGTTDFRDEAAKVDAMVRAIDWAIEQGLHALTYSDRSISAGLRPRLDSAVSRAHAAGIVTTFIHYPHADNLLPGWIGPMSGDDGREPDLNILQYNYGVVDPARIERWDSGDRSRPGDHPFASKSAISIVVAGMVALLRSADPSLGPGDCRRILQETARPVTFDGRTGSRVPDAYQAILHVRSRSSVQLDDPRARPRHHTREALHRSGTPRAWGFASQARSEEEA